MHSVVDEAAHFLGGLPLSAESRGSSRPPSPRKGMGMNRLLVMIGASVGSYLGWWLGAFIGFMMAFFLSVIGLAAGTYFTRRFLREYLG